MDTGKVTLVQYFSVDDCATLSTDSGQWPGAGCVAQGAAQALWEEIGSF